MLIEFPDIVEVTVNLFGSSNSNLYLVYTKYKLEFEEPNRFTVTSTISGNSISNSGTYTVTKGYIVLHYDTGKVVNTPYNYETGDITIDSPFYSNGSDTIF